MRTSIYILLLAWIVSGCNDFLEESSQNEIHPSTVKDMEKLLEGEAYFVKSESGLYTNMTDIFTDNITNIAIGKNNNYREEKPRLRYRYLWDATMWEDNGWDSDISIWQKPYERIKGCNVILEYIDQMLGDDDKREHLKGEAYFLRGFFYFYLTNFFGKPYNCNPETDLAVPLKLTTDVTDEKFTKNTVAECYEQIVSDLKKGAELMSAHRGSQSPKTTRVNYLTSYALLSRTYLYMEDWDNTIRYADSVISQKGVLCNLETSAYKIYVSPSFGTNSETLWVFETETVNGSYGSRYPYPISQDLINVFSEDKPAAIDLRNGGVDGEVNYLEWGFHYEMNDDDEYIYYQDELYGVDKGMSYSGIRISEVYLNRAEAYIHKYMEGESQYAQLALDDLNNIRRNRFAADGYVDKTLSEFPDAQSLMDFCLRERRRELCGEGNHRWFDLRRLGMPKITHVWVDNDTEGETTHVLEEGDSRYVLPIPENVILRNPNLSAQ